MSHSSFVSCFFIIVSTLLLSSSLIQTVEIINGEETSSSIIHNSNINGTDSFISRRKRYSSSDEDNTLKSSLCDSAGHRCVAGSTCLPIESRYRYGSGSDNSGYTCLCPPGLTGQYCQFDVDECLINQCANGATCVNSHGSFSCVCVNGWTGPTCSINIDDCAAASCLNGATCHDRVGSFYCECPPGKTGLLCHMEDACASNPCHYGAICDTSPIDGSYNCRCPKGFTGQDCSQDIDECRSTNSTIVSARQIYSKPEYYGPCEHKGTCINTIGSFKCHCEPGFTGPRCETNINECESNPCQNEGTCLDNPGHFTCVCMPGYTGTRCEHEIDECSSNPCLNGALCNDLINGYKCICPPGFSGINCEENIDDCHSNPCANGAECKDSLDSFICKCLPGFNGQRCETNIDECANNPCIHGTCIDGINKFECKCPIGYTGQLCHQEVNDCLSSPCMFGGTCVDLNASNGTVEYPEKNNSQFRRKGSSSHAQRAQLHYQLLDGNTRGFKCLCPPGTKGPRCEINVDDCWSNPCLNNATCTDLINGYRCNCPPGFTGPTCSLDIDECESSTSVCMNGATCINKTPGFMCICPPGYYGRTCTHDQDDCLSSPCLHDGVCRDHPGRGHYSCICPPAYTGQRCESRMESASACNLNPCAHGATCIPSTGDDGFKCACRPGYTGDRCEININECQTNPCINGGTCLDGVNGFTCLCALPFSGPRCDMSLDPCLFNSCSGRSKCIPSPDLSNYTCLCEPGFQGQTCSDDVDECTLGYLPGRSFRYRHRMEKEILCLNGGTCMNVIGSFRCSCPRGFTGDRCEINVNECEVDSRHPGPICLNGGTCLDLDAKYQCLCRQGWTGSNCQIAVKACSSSPCKNGATCQDATSRGFPSGSYQCSCPVGFSGKNCETNDDDCTSSSCLNGGSCIDGINTYTCRCPPGFSGSNCQEHDEKIRYGAKRVVCRGFDVPLSGSWSSQKYRGNKDCEEVDPWAKCPDSDYCAERFGNQVCDKECNSRSCFYDGNDCEPEPDERVCNELYDDYCIQNYANGRCDPGCNNKACNWDGMDCIDNRTIAARTLPGSINITVDLPLGTMETIEHKTLVAFLRELSNLVPGAVFEIKSKGRDQVSGMGMLELGVNEAFCQNECFTKVTEIAEYMAALQSSSQVFSQSLPGSSLRITSVKAVEEEEAAFHPSKTHPSLPLMLGLCFLLILTGAILGVLYHNSGLGPMRNKKARGITWFPEGFPAASVSSRRDGGAAKAAGGDFSRLRLGGHDGQEMHSMSANLKGEVGQNHTLLRRGVKCDKDSMDTVEESIYDEPLEPRPWTVQHLEAFQGRSATSDYSTTGQLLSPPLYGQCVGSGYPGSPGVGIDVRGPGGLTPLMVASAFDSQNLFCQQKILSASNLFPGSPSTLLRNESEQVSSPTRHTFSPEGNQMANDLTAVSSDVISELIASGACLSKQSETGGETPLHLAARYSRADAAKRLLDAGADCNAVDFAGRTPLHSAIAADARGVFEILLRNRATDLEAQAYDGSTPLILAARLACEGMLEDLVVALNQPGALDAQDEAGRTALHWAASVNNVKAVETLIQSGANRDAQDNKEETPLFLACREGAFQAAKVLLEQGANRDITDHMDRLPRDVASERFHNDIVHLLDEVQPIMNGPGSHHLMNSIQSPSQQQSNHQMPPQPPLMMMSLPRRRRGSTSANEQSSSSTQHLLAAESSSTMSSPPPTPSKPSAGQNVLTAISVNHSRSQSAVSSAPAKKRSASSRRASSAARNQSQQPSQVQPQMLVMGTQSNGGATTVPLLPLVPLSPHLVSSAASTYSTQGPLISTTCTTTSTSNNSNNSNNNNLYSSSGLLLSPPSSSSPMSSSFSPSSHHTLSPPSHHHQHGQQAHPQATYASHYSQASNHGHLMNNQSSHSHRIQSNGNNNSSIPPPAYDEIQGIQNPQNNIYDQIHTFYSSFQPLFLPSTQIIPSITSTAPDSSHQHSPYSYELHDQAAYLTPSPDSPENGGLVYSPDPTRIADWTNVDMNPGSNNSCSSGGSSSMVNNNNGNNQAMTNKINISSNPAPSQQSVFI